MRSSTARGAAIATLALAVTAAATGCGTADGAAQQGATKVTITLTPDGCQPKPTTIKAGQTTFEVTNKNATKVSEAELLDGKQIIGEKENLTPGLSGSFSLNLEAGEYQVYCPNATKDHWSFRVTGKAAKSTLSPEAGKALDKATSRYHDYVVVQAKKLRTVTKRFTDAVRAGDMAKAKRLYADARYPYETIEPVAESFGGLDPKIDARVNDVESGQRWTGFHRIEKALWRDRSLAGMKPVANQLDHDVARLDRLVRTTHYQPAQLANGATELLNEVASSKITGEENRYSHTDLSDFEANIVGGEKAFDLLKPALAKTDKSLANRVSAEYGHVLDALAKYHGDYAGTDFVNYTRVSQAERRTLTQQVDALAEPLSKVAARVSG